MFNFIKNRFGVVKGVTETQREMIERALAEVNQVVALMADKPKVTIDPATGSVTLDLPDQMPDEALALPAPETTEEDKTTDNEDALEDAKV